MKFLLIALLMSISTSVVWSQNTTVQEGYIVIVDATAESDVYYISPFMKCDSPTNNDAIDSLRDVYDAQFKAYVLANYKLENYSNVNNNWLEPGRGMSLEKSYNSYIRNLTITKKAIKIIRVENFIMACKAE